MLHSLGTIRFCFLRLVPSSSTRPPPTPKPLRLHPGQIRLGSLIPRIPPQAKISFESPEPPAPAPADPSEEEKATLVRLTGVSLRQINNWLSNARVRIWRPTVEALHK